MATATATATVNSSDRAQREVQSDSPPDGGSSVASVDAEQVRRQLREENSIATLDGTNVTPSPTAFGGSAARFVADAQRVLGADDEDVGDAVGGGCGCGLRRDQLAVRVHVRYAFLGQVMC